MVVEYFVDQAGEHRFRLKAGTGEVIATSEGYGSEHDAARGLVDLMDNVMGFSNLTDTERAQHTHFV
jgi:uncharacterized protein YegP (UPF0339 family)